MNNLEKPPGEYNEHIETVMTNFDHTIDNEVAEKLQKENLISQYSGWNFCGWVWWDRKKKKWVCMIKQYQIHMETIYAKTLREIMDEVSEKYGEE